MYKSYFDVLKSEKKRIFLSFAFEDLDHVRGLRLLKDNPDFDLEFYDESVKEPIDSENADYIKQKIREKIKRSSATLCLVSEVTYKSKWVDWELETSDKFSKKIIAMAIKGVEKDIVFPKFIEEQKITVWKWSIDKLKELLEKV